MQHHIIYRDPGAYSCFPAIARGQDDKLWVTFRWAGGFSVEALRRGLYDHVDPGSRIGFTHSTDGGLTWGPAQILPEIDPECGAQDPSISVLRDGTLLINYFRWRVVPAGEKDRLLYPARQQYDGSWSDVEGPWVIRSTDGGATWDSEPTPVPSVPLPRAGVSDAPIQLPDGTLLMGFYGADPGENVCRAYAVRSIDGGFHWGEPALIGRDPEGKISFEEPTLVRLPSGRLLAMLRSGQPGAYQYLYQVYSDDHGHTWSTPEPTPMWGHPAHLLLLADGRLLCSYGYRREPFGIRACISRDGGQHWDMANEIVLRDDGASRDIGYPCTAQLADGTLVTVYYIHIEDGVRHIAATRWRLEA
jgi:sialidase-1